MKGSPEVISTLRAAQSAEGHLNLQYRLDARCLKAMGVKKTSRHICKYGDDAHDFLQFVTDRVLFLSGDPSYPVAPLVQQNTITSLLENALAMEMAIVQPYEKAIQIAQVQFDDTTRNLFEHLIKWHQGHVEWLEGQLRLIVGLGEAGYISEKL